MTKVVIVIIIAVGLLDDGGDSFECIGRCYSLDKTFNFALAADSIAQDSLGSEAEAVRYKRLHEPAKANHCLIWLHVVNHQRATDLLLGEIC